MEDKVFVFSPDLSRRLVQLRYENDWLFKKKKQPWREFHQILLDNGFPKEMTVKHVRKKWSYMYDTYRLAKKDKNKEWKYYKLFDKHCGKAKVLDKYDSWNDEWRLKLITCIAEAKALKVDFMNMWKTVERAMRSQDLPENCCIQDIKGLWHHIRLTFNRKYRVQQRRGGGGAADWPLYGAMLQYHRRLEPGSLAQIAACRVFPESKLKKASDNYRRKPVDVPDDEYEFQWSKNITESFIQVRLQNDWLFRERKWAWNDLLAIMTEEHGFPKALTGREICRKWAATFAEYQKAKATNNKSWVYYNLFELYLGEGSFSLNPLVGWQEEWVSNLISARIDLDHLFRFAYKEQADPWREVEKRLRSTGLPLDHSLLELPEIWTHLLKTYKWKKKFADKGMLTEQWPYFEALAQYDDSGAHHKVKKQKQEPDLEQTECNDDYDDDIKLFELKQKLDLQVNAKPEPVIETNQCRSCMNEDACLNIFTEKDENGYDIAYKLRIIGGIQVEPADSLPARICMNCAWDLETAFKFRRKCQNVDKELRKGRSSARNIKVEVNIEGYNERRNMGCPKDDPDDATLADVDTHYDDFHSDTEPKKPKLKVKKEPPKIRRKKRRVRKEKYEYHKICEICGRHTKNLVSHLDTHASDKLYSCDVCDKKFKFKSGMIIHRAIHDPTPRKTCEVCGKTFHIMAQYRRHFVYHANERKFECETCGKRFNTLDILRVHNRTHTDERPFNCIECGKTFRTAGCVSRHKRIVHRSIKSQ